MVTTSRSTISRPIVPPAAGTTIFKRIDLSRHVDGNDGLVSVGMPARFVVSVLLGSIVDVGDTVKYNVVDI